MRPPLRILHLEDDVKDADLIRATLEADGLECEIAHVDKGPAFLAAAEQGGFDLILADFHLPNFDGLAALAIARKRCPDVPFILVSGAVGDELAVEVLKSGAADYVLKDNLVRLPSCVRRALKDAKDRAALKQAEEGIKSLARFPSEDPSPVLRAAKDGTVTYSNAAAQAVMGVCGCVLGERLPNLCLQAVLQSFATGTKAELEVPCGDRLFSFLIVPIVGEGYVNLYGRDITEPKLAEAELRKFCVAVEHSPTVVMITDTDGRIEYVSRAFTHITGYARPEIIGRNVNELGDQPAEDRQQMWETLTAGRTWRGEFHNKKKNGEYYWESASISALRNADRVITHYVKVAEDVTERKQAEETLREQGRFLTNVFASIQDGISVLDADLRIQSVNPAMEQWYQHAMPLVGRKCYEAYHGARKACETCPSQRTLATGKAAYEVVPKRDADGDVVGWLDLFSFPLVDAASGRMTGVIEYVRDITGRKRAEAETERQLHRMAALRVIDTAITGSLDVRLTLDILLAQVTAELGVDAAAVLLLKPETVTLEYATGRGFRTEALKHTRLRLGEGHAGQAALERRVVHIADLAQEANSLRRAPLLPDERFVAYYAAPLIAKGSVVGVLELFHRAPLNPGHDWLEFLQTLAGQAAIAIDNAALFSNLQRSKDELALAYDTTLEGWSRALDLRDKETEGHTQRVAEMTIRLARAMGMNEAELVHVRRGALLHDIGKMGVPNSILLKPDKLTDEEWKKMRLHPVYAYDLLSPIPYLRPALDIPYGHHEKWDGTGYPQGLKGEAIPLSARIFAAVDVWDAMRSDRPYRKALPEEVVREHIRKGSGTHFDPKVVEVFMGVVGG